MENLKFFVTDRWKMPSSEACREHQTKQLGEEGDIGRCHQGPLMAVFLP